MKEGTISTRTRFAFLAVLSSLSILAVPAAMADVAPPDARGDCNNTAYNAFELDDDGNIDDNALYFEEFMNGNDVPLYSSPPGSIVLTLNGPGPVGDPVTSFAYNYINQRSDWLIWRIKISGPEGDPEEEDQIIEFPAQQGRLDYSETPEEAEVDDPEPPDWILFCIVEAGSLTVKKDVNPSHAQDFRYNISSAAPSSVVPKGPYSGFSLDDDPSNRALSNSTTLVLPIRNPPGGEELSPYTLREDAVAGWNLQSINCGGENDDGSVVDVAAREVLVDLDWGEAITCTFVNADATVRIPTKQGLAATGTPMDVRTYGLGLLTLAAALIGGLLIKRPRPQ